MDKSLTVGIIGCGSILAQYLATFDALLGINLGAVAARDPLRAQAAVQGRIGVRACSVQELLDLDDIDVVLNLTTPAAHADIALQVIAAGKTIYGEKPLATNTADARKILLAAKNAGVTVACAPDTVLGTGIQTARAAIDAGIIGTPIAATATMVTPGHERWHPNPDFFYLPGGGPLLDIGPYYISALVTLLGPVKSVIAAASHTRSSRVIGSGPRQGEVIPVNTDTHVTGVLTHHSGALSTLLISFDAVATQSRNIEIHGETGSLIAPDPNRFAGEVLLHAIDSQDWKPLPVTAGYRDAERGYGIADLAATSEGNEPRASGTLAYHVLDVMESMLNSAVTDRGRRSR